MLESSLTVIVTVISGVIVYVLTELFKEIWLEPLRKYRLIKSEIAENLIYYANMYLNPIRQEEAKNEVRKAEYIKASEQIRGSASKLGGYMETISWFHPGVPRKKKLFEAYRELIGLSNSFFMTSSEADIYSQNREYVLNIKTNMGLFSADSNINKRCMHRRKNENS